MDHSNKTQPQVTENGFFGSEQRKKKEWKGRQVGEAVPGWMEPANMLPLKSHHLL